MKWLARNETHRKAKYIYLINEASKKGAKAQRCSAQTSKRSLVFS
jgi:hypothetical protein